MQQNNEKDHLVHSMFISAALSVIQEGQKIYIIIFCFRLSTDFEKCPSSASSQSHRVTFNDKNEVASQDLDGSFTVTYSQLGERITGRKTEGIRVQFGEKSVVEQPVSLYRDIYCGASPK